MEIHPPPHMDHKKKWKDYVFEFFILFLAVTLSFFMENQREHISERHREKEYMKSLSEDLKNDTAMLTQSLKFSQYIATGLDSLATSLYDVKTIERNTVSLYRMNFTYGRRIGVDFNDQTTTQLRNASGMQLVQNQKIADEIAQYCLAIKNIESIIDNYESHAGSAYEMAMVFLTENILPHMLIPSQGIPLLKLTLRQDL
jgi:hypothetical protein